MADSAQSLAQDVTKTNNEGGLLPIQTGNLRNSFTVSTSAMPQVDQVAKEYAKDSWELTIAGADVGDPIFLGFRAVYGPRQNYGFMGEDSLGRSYNQQGKYFVETSASKWNEFVNAAERRYGVK